jgi:hypothetical protein
MSFLRSLVLLWTIIISVHGVVEIFSFFLTVEGFYESSSIGKYMLCAFAFLPTLLPIVWASYCIENPIRS